MIPGQVLHVELTEAVAAAFQFLIQPVQHTEGKLAVTLNRDHPGVRQFFVGVAFEFHALLEVDQIELDLIRAAGQRQIGDDHMEEGGFPRPGFPGKQGVLAGALADGQHLVFDRAGPADRDAEFVGGVSLPVVLRHRRNLGEGHFHAAGVDAGLADTMQQRQSLLGGRR